MSQLQRTVPPEMDPQLRGDSPHRHAGPLIGMLRTWGSDIALMRVCTMDIQCLNNKSPGVSQLQRTVSTKMDQQLRGDSPCHHVGPLILNNKGPCMSHLQRTVLLMDQQLRGDSQHCHAGPIIGILRTWGLYIALTRVCTVDIQCLNNKSPCKSHYRGLHSQRWTHNSVGTHRIATRAP
jgi:hypothetical protein